jgi:hypothetical protein
MPTATRSIFDHASTSELPLIPVTRHYLFPIVWTIAALPAISAGCRTGGAMRNAAPPPSFAGGSENGSSCAVPAIPGVVGVGAPQTFEIAFTTFIPANHVVAPWMHPQSYAGPGRRLVFAGDDRMYDVDATRFRARQRVTVVADAALDADGLVEGSKQNLGGRTESFVAAEALADGRIDDADRDDVLGDAKHRHAAIAVDPAGLIVDDPVRLGPRRVSVRLRTAPDGGPRDELIAGAPSIDWDLTLVIDTTGDRPKYELTGTWDGYPACELYVNRKPILLRSPGPGPASFTDLLKLGPKLADEKIELRGTLE